MCDYVCLRGTETVYVCLITDIACRACAYEGECVHMRENTIRLRVFACASLRTTYRVCVHVCDVYVC